jgi:glutamate synthase domain-containing protein 2/glutamate synthase domain-containing protein 1/glutamate synthase domain-containing protein 3
VEKLPLSQCKHGLYDPRYERDACGVGLVANISGKKSHDILEKGMEILVNLSHRGACGCDPLTGDGAGILIQIPHQFLKQQCADIGINLPGQGEYGVGMVFLPSDLGQRQTCEALVQQVIEDEGQGFLGWRDVPGNNAEIGYIARDSQPSIRQVFIARGSQVHDEAHFERKLYVIRKVIERALGQRNDDLGEHFYIASLSCNRVVYKGLLLGTQIKGFYPDLSDPAMSSAFAMVHARFSTNTLGSWKLAHPYRLVCHNGEINTVRGNINWMTARQAMFSSDQFGDDMEKLFPIITPGASDTAAFDNTLELLLATGRSLPHALMMMIPEATGEQVEVSQDKRDFYEYHSSMMEPWDGPALIAATDGTRIGVVLDRNGLRPFRYVVTKSDLLVMASEVGVLDIPPEEIRIKERIHPGRMFLLDTNEARIIDDQELKADLSRRQPYGRWLADNKITLDELPEPKDVKKLVPETLDKLQRTFGYTIEDLQILMEPMAVGGTEAIGSMGNDTPLAVLSGGPQLLFSYFKQLFAQVSNPPLDAIREELVTSLEAFIGSEQNLFSETPEHSHQLKLKQPILSNAELEKVRNISVGKMMASTCSTLFDIQEYEGSLELAVDKLCRQVSAAVEAGSTIIILSDRGVDARHAPIPSLLATAAVHHHLIREGTRTKVGLVVESGEPREVMHFALLIGYGAGAINPYLAFEILHDLAGRDVLGGQVDGYIAEKNFVKAVGKGVLKIMSKMGISTVQSYRGAQIFEAVGLNEELVDRYFTWTSSRIQGIGIDTIEEETRRRHSSSYANGRVWANMELDQGGYYQWRRDGEYHMYNPETISLLQQSTGNNSYETYEKFAESIDRRDRQLSTLRGLMDFKSSDTPLLIDEVEPASEIVKRFATGAISLGAISREAHETLAIATNRIGAKSNTGEGGEDYRRFIPDPNGDSRKSAVKQVASGRFGVTTNYLVNATDLQIKMAQGSKPGEGGQLPGLKVDEYIGWIRHTTPGVELISPPPHHDIYSIEDLAQLIHDLKNVNPQARIHVKLVSEIGVGIIAAGVAKGHGDVVLISGDSGGTGASPESSIKHAGLPWELGLAETHQVLLMNDLRGRIVVQTDGQLKTGRDVAVACLLGAEEFGFSTAPLITMGCIMLRKCHLNTCSVGIATQDPELRKRFAGKPESLINYFFFIAEHLRRIMAQMGFRTVNEMVGRMDRLEPHNAVEHWKARGLDLTPMLQLPEVSDNVATYCQVAQDHGLDQALDHQLIELSKAALENGERVDIQLPIRNSNRVVGTMLSGEVAKRYGEEGLPEDTINCLFWGSAGQSYGAFLAGGISLTLEGDANDHFCKGMSGGRSVVYPLEGSTFVPEKTTIVGNVVLYGATGGKVFIRGLAGERFAVRNSGAQVVVEGVGDHGCEYMTGGTVIVLGAIGRNFAAGMSGGVAYVLDEDGSFSSLCNVDMVGLEPVVEEDDRTVLRHLIEEHLHYTKSESARRVLETWEDVLPRFVKVMPHDYKRVLEERKESGLTTESVSIG